MTNRYGFEMGVDVARGPEESVVYIQAGTAWRQTDRAARQTKIKTGEKQC